MSEVLDDPFATPAADETVMDDPFASADDVKTSGGVFVPRPPIEVLADRLVVLVPRSFDKEAKVSDYLREKYNMAETREEWTIDLIVLDGGTMEYAYRSKVQGKENEFEDKTMTVSEFPFTVPNFKVSWGNIIGTLNKLADGPKPFGLGRVRAGYSAKEMRSGKTFADFAEEMQAWEDRVKKSPRTAGERPKAKWHFEIDESAPARAKAMEWWNVAKAEGFKVR